MAGRDTSGQLLLEVADAISKHGRPRKNPGAERPVAVLNDGRAVSKVLPRHIPEIRRLSLPGAFRYVEISGKYAKAPSEKAKRAFYQEQTGHNGFEAGDLDVEIARIDQNVSDSRLLIRNLRAARKKLHKAAL